MNNKLNFSDLEKVKAEFGDFQIGQVMGGNNDIYFRFGYWGRVNAGKLQEILGDAFVVIEDDMFDDDCGWLYSYKIK